MRKANIRFTLGRVYNWITTSLVIVLISIASNTVAFASDDYRPLMRFPDIHDSMIVFVYGEDIWTVTASGGVANRITINDGEEKYPKFSPDGTLIAFTGEYDGNLDVYVMDIYGGNIRRVTYHPGEDAVVGWHQQKNKIIFCSFRASFGASLRLYLIAPDGTGLEELILNEAATGSFSPDGHKIAYNKISREDATWKRYQGGTAEEIFTYDLTTDEEKNISNFAGTDRNPMWIDDKIYFNSDRNRVLNIYAFDTKTEQIEQITNHTDYDVRRPSASGNKIVYELGGELWVLDVNSNQTSHVSVQIRADRPEVRPYLKQVDKFIGEYDISPSGARAVITARGEVFTVPKKDGETRNLTNNSGARSRGAVWSPDGKTIAYLSDDSGEYEIYLIDPLGKTKAIRLTQHKDGYRHTLGWSPDSKKIAFADQTHRFYYIDIATLKITEIDKANYEDMDVSLDCKPINDYSWSPDSRYVAYAKMDSTLLYGIYIYSLEKRLSYKVSSGLFSDFDPIFTRDGQHLLFISNRRFSPTFCDFEWEMVYKKAAAICALTLQKDGKPLLPLKTDEEIDGGTVGDGENEKKGESVAQKPNLNIDFEGLADRIEMLPLAPGNYRNLSTNDSALFFLNSEDGDYNRIDYRPLGSRTLYKFSLLDSEQKSVLDSIDGYHLSIDGAHIIYRKGDTVGLKEIEGDAQILDLSQMTMMLDPLAEWRQMFNETWRMERDFYYEPNMHGLDWKAMNEKYGCLLPYASCRQDIEYTIGELIGELNTSHTYVWGGDPTRKANPINVGMLGVDWEIDAIANRYRFKKIFRVTDWTQNIVPPLVRPDAKVTEGDYLIQVNNQDVIAGRDIYSYFQNLADRQITILVNNRPTVEGAREYVVKPLSEEYTIRYLDWVENNRHVAEQASGGQIGYIHLPDTFVGSAREFPKYFYSQTRKKGLIVDGRFNSGGLDPDIFLQRLNKGIGPYFTRRYSHDQTILPLVTKAYMACLTNRQSGSGGDLLPYEFRQNNMGPIIGTRTWGGLIGFSTLINLVDGGIITAPDYRAYGADGKWIIENEGVEPDITVELSPAEIARGYDAQLMKAIEVLMEKINSAPREWPEHESFPVDR